MIKYIIPFKKRPIRVGQGFNEGSHVDWLEDKEDMTYSVDFLLPEGTELLASRGGEVTKVKKNGTKSYAGKDSVKGEKAYKKHMNEIEIKHNDGTFASYSHLKNKGVFVNVGDKVKQGQVIGLSGNTGWSSEPHLDFCVFKKNYKNRKIKTIKFAFEDYNKSLERNLKNDK
jgi:murein DD-endopeptidase MepM/ murein hydrolase activator NlpD